MRFNCNITDVGLFKMLLHFLFGELKVGIFYTVNEDYLLKVKFS